MDISAEKDALKTLEENLAFQKKFQNFNELKDGAETLLTVFQKQGYLESELENISKKNDSTYQATYFLGNRWNTIIIQFEKGTLPLGELKKISKTVSDTSFEVAIENLERSLKLLTKFNAEKGDPFSKLQLSEIKKINREVLSARLLQTKNQTRTIDGIVIKGYEKFPVSFLKYFVGIKKGKIFNQTKINKQNDIIDNLGFANAIKPPEALFKKDSTTLYFYIEKANNNNFDGILGFATNEETQKLEFNGYLNLELNNNLNFGEQLLLNYKADGNDQQNFRVRTYLPYLFKSPFGISLELKIFKRDSTFSTTEQLAKVHYQPSPRLSFFSGYKAYESSNLLNENIAGLAVEDFKSDFVLLGANYTIQQKSPLFPLKTIIGLETEIGKRSSSESEQDQVRLGATLSQIFNLNARNSVYLQNNTQFLSSDTYLSNELFRFGGINSIRGFNENSIDASLLSVVNTEYRYLLNSSSYIHSIIDVGYFENKTLDISSELYSFGLGIGLNTKAGLFRLNIANGISKDQNFEFYNTKVHISLNSSF